MSKNKRKMTPLERYEKIMRDMENVDTRREMATPENVTWFLRSGWVLNQKHPKVNEAIEIAKTLFNK